MPEASTQTLQTDHDKTTENAEENSQLSHGDTASSNCGSATSRQFSSQPWTRQLFLVNRVNYFAFVVSLSAPIVNFCIARKSLGGGGVAFDLMLWILFGIFWCAAFAQIMGLVFTFVAVAIQVLDIVPALGSSLWTVLSIWLTVVVLNDFGIGSLAFLNNLPLFSLIMANFIAAVSNFQLDTVFGRAHFGSPSNGNSCMTSAMRHSFMDGKCSLTYRTGNTQVCRLANFSFLCVSEEFLIAYKTVRDKSLKYLHGENLDEFSSSFDNWRSEARRIRRILLLRRLFCLLGYILETAALYFSFVFLNHIKGHKDIPTDKDQKEVANDTIELLLPIWQIAIVVILSFLSHYLWVFIDVESTCTSPAEVSSLMLRKMDSWINWSGPKSGFLDNGRRKWSLVPRRGFGEVLAGELPTIGIVADDNALEAGTRQLRSAVTGFEFTVRRIASDTIRLQLAREDEREKETLCSASVEAGESDKVV